MLTSNVPLNAVVEVQEGSEMAYIGKSFSADQVQRKVGTLAPRVPKKIDSWITGQYRYFEPAPGVRA